MDDKQIILYFFMAICLLGQRKVSGKFTAKIYRCFACICLPPEALLDIIQVKQRSIYFHPICHEYFLQSHKPHILPVHPSLPTSFRTVINFVWYSSSVQTHFWSHHNGGRITFIFHALLE